MKPYQKPITALLLGMGAIILSQGISHAIMPKRPPQAEMPKGVPLSAHVTDFTPKPTPAIIAPTAYLHPTSKLIGAVHIGDGTWVGPRASLRADLGHDISIGGNCNLQDGVVIWGYATEAEGKKLKQRSVEERFGLGDAKKGMTSVKIEDGVSLLPQAQVVGPSLIERGSFIGAGALVYQSRVGAGSVIEAGAQIINVELPANTYVAAGQIVSNPEVAKRLPSVEAARANQNKELTALYARLTKGYLNRLEESIPMEQQQAWRGARKEVLWMPSIPLAEHPTFESPKSDAASERNPKAVTIGAVELRASFVAAGAILRADYGGKIDIQGASIEEGAILVSDLSPHVELPAPASQPTSEPANNPAGDVPPTEPLPIRPPINELRPNLNPEPASTPTSEPSSAPASAPAPKEPGIFVADGAQVQANAIIYGSSTIQAGAVIKPRAIIISSDIGPNVLIKEGAVVSNVYIPEGRVVESGRTISTQKDALSLPTQHTYLTGTIAPAAKAFSNAAGPALIKPLATVDLTSIGDGQLRVEDGAYVSDHTFFITRDTGSIEIGAGSFIQSGATLYAQQSDALRVAPHAVVSAQAFISGSTSLEEGSVVGARALIVNSIIGEGAVVEPGAILIAANVPKNMLVPAGTVLSGNAEGLQAIDENSPWRGAQREALFAGESFAKVFSETPKKADLRGANKPKEVASSSWISAQTILLALLFLLVIGMLGFGAREVEK